MGKPTRGVRALRRLGAATLLVVVATAVVAVLVVTRSAGTGGSPDGVAVWRPAPGLRWQWQLDGPVDVTTAADVFDLDAFDTSSAAVAELHRRGRRVVCYVDVGAVESYRPDAGAFPSDVVGRVVDGWEQERYLDIRRLDVVGPILAARLDLCRRKGFDGVEGDLVDAYANDSGFPITRADQVRFLRWFAREAHRRGLAAGLKNVSDLLGEVGHDFDFAVVEGCFASGTCQAWRPFLASGKAVFAAEYQPFQPGWCAQARDLGISLIEKREGLDAWRVSC